MSFEIRSIGQQCHFLVWFPLGQAQSSDASNLVQNSDPEKKEYAVLQVSRFAEATKRLDYVYET